MTSFFFESGFKGYLNEYVIHAFILNTPNYAMSYACSRPKQPYTNYLCRAPNIEAVGIISKIFSRDVRPKLSPSQQSWAVALLITQQSGVRYL